MTIFHGGMMSKSRAQISVLHHGIYNQVLARNTYSLIILVLHFVFYKIKNSSEEHLVISQV